MAKKKQQDLPRSVGAVHQQPDDSKVWSVFSLVSALAGATLAKKALSGGWKAATGKEPPANPADPDVRMAEAVAWAAVSGTTIALARMLASRRAARYFVRSTGHLPGQLAADGNAAKKPSKKPSKKAKKS